MGELITVRQLCERSDCFNGTVAEATVYDWRARGIGPASFKLNGRVVYDLDDVREWITAQKSGGAS